MAKKTSDDSKKPDLAYKSLTKIDKILYALVGIDTPEIDGFYKQVEKLENDMVKYFKTYIVSQKKDVKLRKRDLGKLEKLKADIEESEKDIKGLEAVMRDIKRVDAK